MKRILHPHCVRGGRGKGKGERRGGKEGSVWKCVRARRLTCIFNILISTVRSAHYHTHPPTHTHQHTHTHSYVTPLQWRSQDEQVTWAQHGHTHCVRSYMRLLGDLGHAPAMKILNLYTLRPLLRPFSVTDTILQTYLYARFMSA